MDGKSSTLSVGLVGPTRTFWTCWPRVSRSCGARDPLHNSHGPRRDLCGMLAKARTAAQTDVWARFATPASARKGPPHAGLRDNGPPRALRRLASGSEPDLRGAPTRRPVLSQTRPMGVMQRVPRAKIQWLTGRGAAGRTHAAGHEAVLGSEQGAMARTAALRGAAAAELKRGCSRRDYVCFAADRAGASEPIQSAGLASSTTASQQKQT